jgi:hypothetical protein
MRYVTAVENGPQTYGSLRKKTRWRVLAVRAMVVGPLAYHSRHSEICKGTLPDMPQFRPNLLIHGLTSTTIS